MKTQVSKVLRKYLNEEKALEYSTKLFPYEKRTTQSKYKKSNKLNMSMALQIKTLVNYAEENLSDEELYSFLFNLGKISIEENELSLAAEINNQIINKCSRNSKLANISSYALLKLAKICFKTNEYKKSLEFAESAKNCFFEQKDSSGLYKADYLIGETHLELGNLEKSKHHFEEAAKCLNYKKDFHQLVTVENKLGEVEYLLENYNKSLTYYNRILIKFEQIEHNEHSAITHMKLGLVFIKINQFDAALLEFNKGLFLALKIKNSNLTAKIYLNKAKIYLEKSDYKLGMAYIKKAHDIADKLADESLLASVFALKGLLEKLNKQYDLAEEYLRTSLRMNEELGDILNSAAALNELGKLFLELNHKEEASSYFEDASNFYKKAGHSVLDSQIREFKLYD